MNRHVAVAAVAVVLALSGVGAALAQLNAQDREFMTKAALDGMTEVRLGEVATQRAAAAPVKEFGQHMVTEHGRANSELMGLAREKGVTLPAELDAEHRATVDRLSRLSGAEFDRAYMGEMVTDHQKAVALFQRESREGGDAAVKAWAGKTLPALQMHLQRARDVAQRVGAGGAAESGEGAARK